MIMQPCVDIVCKMMHARVHFSTGSAKTVHNWFSTGVTIGGQETLLIAEEGLEMVPGKGYCPIYILLKQDTEYLAFLKISDTDKLNPIAENQPLCSSDIAKSSHVK
jgi:hypothetical protein